MKENNDKPGTSFVNHQKTMNQAKNERVKDELDTDKLDPEQANKAEKRNHKTDVSVKKTGAGKQSSRGD